MAPAAEFVRPSDMARLPPGYDRRFMKRRARQLLGSVAAQLWLAAAAAAQQDLRALLPDDSLAVVSAGDPRGAVRALHAAVGDVPKGLPPEVAALVGTGLLFLRTVLGGDPDAFVERLAAGGAAFAVVADGEQARSLLVLRPGDLQAARAWFAARGEGVHAETVGDLLLVANDREGCARLRAGVEKPGSRWVSAATGTAVLSGTVDLAAVRARLGERAVRVAALDGGGRFLLVPIAYALEAGTALRFSVHGGAALTLQADVDAAVVGSKWEGLLAAKGEPRAMLPLLPEGVALLSLDRSLRSLLAHAERFLGESDQVGVQSFLSIAEALDGASTSFLDDLLGGLREPFTVHVLPVPAAADGEVQSPLQLPGLVLTAPIGEPAVEPILSRMAQVLATIANGERAQRGQRPFVLRALRSELGKGFVAEAPEWRGPGLPPIETALSPTLLCGHGHMVLATTTAAAEQVLGAAAAGKTQQVTADLAIVRGPQLAALLTRSRAALELGRMLDEGEGPADARRFFSTLIALAEALREATLRATVQGGTTHLELRLERRR
jgi:hypothetical protein